MNIVLINQTDSTYPSSFKKYFTDNAQKTIAAIGNPNILQNKTLAIFSSIKCPGKIILKTYDMMRQLRDSDMTVISGFHSPMERECLNILLRQKQPVIICPARSIEGMRIKKEYKTALKEGRVLILSPFGKKHNRISSELSNKRNLFIKDIADEVLVPYAAPGSKTETLCVDLIKKGKNIKTFKSEYNKRLIELGIETI